MFNSILNAVGNAISSAVKSALNAASSAASSVGGIVTKYYYNKNVYSPQIKALEHPYSSCFSHSTAWFLKNEGIEITPDQVTERINGPEYTQWAISHYGADVAEKFKDNLQVLWELQLQFIKDRFADFGISYSVKFNQSTTVQSIIDALKLGPVIVGTSPYYKKTGKTLGHIMLIVGADDACTEWVIDDPFGDFRTGYDDNLNGDDIVYSISDFEKIRNKTSIMRIA